MNERLILRNSDGFTLLELLVSLALLSLIAAFIASSLSFGKRTWERAEQLEQTAPVAAVQDFLHRTLSATQPAFEVAPDRNLAVAFSGLSTGMNFVAQMPGHVIAGGLHRLKISVEPAVSGQVEGTLSIAYSVFRPRADSSEQERIKTARVLLNSVRELQLRYYGSVSRTSAPSWQNAWSRRDALPTHVEIIVRFPTGDPRHWAPMIVPLRLAQAATNL